MKFSKIIVRFNFGELLSIIIGIIPIIYDYSHNSKISIESIGMSLILFNAGILISFWISRTAQIADADDKHEVMKEYVLGTTKTVYLGRASEAKDKFAALIYDAEQVWNVYINTIIDENEIGFDQKGSNSIVNAYKYILKDKKVEWTEILGGNLIGYMKRFDGIDPKKVGANFKFYKLSTDFPAINFVIIKRKSHSDEEVFFGWGLHSRDANAEVFWSKNQAMVRYFKHLHYALKDSAKFIKFSELYHDNTKNEDDIHKGLNIDK